MSSLFTVNAQNDKFTLPEKEGDVLQGQWVVLDVLGTPKENYDKVINYVNKTYNTPSEVLKSQIDGKYVCIAPHASAHAKYWNHPGGWQTIIDYLKEQGYKAVKLEKNKPDIAFIGYPPIESAYVITRWLRSKKVPYILDVKDQWPSFIVDALPKSIRGLGRAILSPYFILAKKLGWKLFNLQD